MTYRNYHDPRCTCKPDQSMRYCSMHYPQGDYYVLMGGERLPVDMPTKQTSGMKVVRTLWPESNRFDTAWGEQTAEGLAECIDKLTAAPELLEACKAALITFSQDEFYSETKEVQKTIKQAIAKAEGRGK